MGPARLREANGKALPPLTTMSVEGSLSEVIFSPKPIHSPLALFAGPCDNSASALWKLGEKNGWPPRWFYSKENPTSPRIKDSLEKLYVFYTFNVPWAYRPTRQGSLCTQKRARLPGFSKRINLLNLSHELSTCTTKTGGGRILFWKCGKEWWNSQLWKKTPR